MCECKTGCFVLKGSKCANLAARRQDGSIAPANGMKADVLHVLTSQSSVFVHMEQAA